MFKVVNLKDREQFIKMLSLDSLDRRLFEMVNLAFIKL